MLKSCELGDKYLPMRTEFSFVNSRKLYSSASYLMALLDNKQLPFFPEYNWKIKCLLTAEHDPGQWEKI